eukprot:3911634-Amphidinium_carterae.1
MSVNAEDLMVLSSTGRNTAYTYSVDHYAELGRRRGALCFGFKGNMEDDRLKTASDIAFEELLADLQSRGQSDEELRTQKTLSRFPHR